MIPGAFFLLCVIANLTGKMINPAMANFTKAALLPLLAFTTLTAAAERGIEPRILRYLMLAQLFGCTGDVLLIFNGFLPFIGGMVSFLIGHIFYLLIFGGKSWKGFGWKQWVPAIVAIEAIVGALLYFIGVEGDLLVPMIVYANMLMLLIFSAAAGLVRFGGKTWWIILCGAVIFTISDSLIAIGVFNEDAPKLNDFFVMFTYIVAQVLLAIGTLRLYRR